MGRMNMGRLIAGGLVAGVVGNVLHAAIGMYLTTVEMSDMQRRLGLSQDVINSSMATWIIVDFVWGLLLVFTYAAMRPRFGPGPKTAVVSGVTLWLGVASVFAGLTAIGVYTEQAYIKETFLNLVTVVAASLAGAAVYKE
jgi:hypothetical protein